MKKLNLAYLTPDSAKNPNYDCCLIPKELIINPIFEKIECGAKLLYSLLLKRAGLSASNADKFTPE